MAQHPLFNRNVLTFIGFILCFFPLFLQAKGSIYLEDNKTKTASKNRPDLPVLAPLSIVPFLVTNKDTLLKGSSLDSRVAVWDRLETVGMNFKHSPSDPNSLADLDAILIPNPQAPQLCIF